MLVAYLSQEIQTNRQERQDGLTVECWPLQENVLRIPVKPCHGGKDVMLSVGTALVKVWEMFRRWSLKGQFGIDMACVYFIQNLLMIKMVMIFFPKCHLWPIIFVFLKTPSGPPKQQIVDNSPICYLKKN